MQASSGIASLRSSAARWSLAGDKMLLDILQELHQNMISKCEKTNSELLTLTNAIADADIALQTVNNRMMALSNSQFVESRVYDDELATSEDVTEQNMATKVIEIESDTSKLKRGIKTLENMHEAVEIHHESESDTDSDLELYSCRVVLKPLDVYADRPLPHIIGSHAWKSKWHAGLYPEDSESESESSHEFEQTENVLEEPHQVQAEPVEQQESSSSSSEVGAAEMSQAEVAAALARRLAGDVPQIPQRDIDTVPEPRSIKEYQPKPLSTVREPIFFDEPPPLDQTYQSEDDNYSQEDDIFAELYKSKPNASGNSAQNQVTDELFGDFASNVQEDLFGRAVDIKSQNNGIQHQNTASKNTSGTSYEKVAPGTESVLPEQDKKSEIATTSVMNPTAVNKQETVTAVKKPIGGISLFGNNEGAERIGAAILRRNQRESSTSSNESGNHIITDSSNKVKPKYTQQDQEQKPKLKENLIDNLFGQQEKTKLVGQGDISAIKERKVVEKEKKIDLFSDNLFDDVDDIFSSNVVVKIPKKEENKGKKSIFDDDDDLFADVALTKNKEETKLNTTPKTLFDSDDELFSEKNIVKSPNILTIPTSGIASKSVTSPPTTNVSISSKNIVHEESDDDIFSGSKSSEDKNKLQPRNYLESCNTEKSNVNITSGIAAQLSTNVEEHNIKLDKNLLKEGNQIFIEENATLSKKEYLNISKNTDSEIIPVKDDDYNKYFDDNELSSEDKHKIPEAMLFNETRTPVKEVDTSNKVDISTSVYKEQEVPNVTSAKSPSIFSDDNTDDNLYDPKNKTGFTPREEKGKAIVQSKEKLDNTPTISSKSNLKENTKTELEVKNDNTGLTSVASNEEFYSQGTYDNNLLHSHNHEIFSDSFDEQPPVFEKPKEPKKSKNINALFDDDSDDEALFFKRNDVDDKPEDLPSNNNQDKLFDIFHDEPPALDIDFIQKTPKGIETNVHENIQKQDFRVTENVIVSQIEKEYIVPSESENIDLTKHNLAEADYIKEVKVGKLKLPNLNINVNTLLPGASPNKILNIAADAADGHTTSKDFIDKFSATNSPDSGVEPESNSISIEQKSAVLDNKFSKERAKIQVKRRPSTRRARREAVRKSMVVAENDSTDNSSSFNISKDDAILEKQRFPKADSINKESSVNSVISKTVYILNDEDIFPHKKPNSNQSVTKIQEAAKDIPYTKSLQIVDDDIDEMFKIKSDLILGNPDVRSEIKKGSITTLGKVYTDITSNKEEIVDPKQSHEISCASNINSTQASVKIDTQISKKTTKPSLFDDLSDDESKLFGVAKAAVIPKSKIFDSDSENELFAGVNKGKNIKKKEVVQIKGSLFDNDNDDAGIFSGGSNKTERVERDKGQKSTADASLRDPLSTLLDED